MSLLISIVLLPFLIFADDEIASSSSTTCPLFWSSRQNLGYGQGVQLQVCCNVSRVRIWSFQDIGSFSQPSIAYEEKFPNPQEADMWTDLQLSICSDRSEPTIGWVGSRPGVTCQHRKGQVLTIPTGALSLPGWYLICYIMPDGCQTCLLDILCENEFTDSCSDKHILSSSPVSSNSTIDYWVQIGKKFPFSNSASVEVSVRHQRTKNFVTTEYMKAQTNTTTTITIHDLKAHEFYNIKRCLRVRLPAALVSDSRFSFSEELKTNGSLFCIEEMYRTLRNSSSKQSFSNLIIAIHLALFLIFFAH